MFWGFFRARLCKMRILLPVRVPIDPSIDRLFIFGVFLLVGSRAFAHAHLCVVVCVCVDMCVHVCAGVCVCLCMQTQVWPRVGREHVHVHVRR